jgi:hypothetical protein
MESTRAKRTGDGVLLAKPGPPLRLHALALSLILFASSPTIINAETFEVNSTASFKTALEESATEILIVSDFTMRDNLSDTGSQLELVQDLHIR